MNNFDNTIAAISTPIGAGGIGIVRLSGKQAITIANKLFSSIKGKDLLSAKTHTLHYGHVVSDRNEIIDEALFTVMKAPNSYTGENVVEISVHGSSVSLKKTLDSAILAGARLASAGEFTKRGFLNGKFDLAQAEAVIDIINSKTSLSHDNALSQLEGRLSESIMAMRDVLLNVAAAIGVSADYSDEGFDEDGINMLKDKINSTYDRVCHLISTADYGSVLKNGILTAIVGSPNVGKSSFLNLLAGYDRAIVTNIAGTTRDVIEEEISLGDITLRLADTAGIRQTDDFVEGIGIQRSKECIESADLIIVIIDGTQAVTKEDLDVLEQTKDKNRIILINKTDLDIERNLKDIENSSNGSKLLPISAKNGDGLDDVIKEIRSTVMKNSIEADSSGYITNSRHKEALIHAKEYLELCQNTLNINECVDFVMIDLQEAISSLGEIIGMSISEEIVDKIFSGFCVGK